MWLASLTHSPLNQLREELLFCFIRQITETFLLNLVHLNNRQTELQENLSCLVVVGQDEIVFICCCGGVLFMDFFQVGVNEIVFNLYSSVWLDHSFVQ